MTVSAIVFIKQESERLPNKNFRSFNGTPLFRIILDTLNAHPYIQEILVNTDSPEVLEYVERQIPKGKGIRRPEHLLGQHIGANELIAHDTKLSDSLHFFQTHCTTPLLSAKTISESIEKYFSLLPGHDSLFSVTKVQHRLYDHRGEGINHDKNIILRTQDLDPVFMENAAFFIFPASTFNTFGSRIGKAPYLYEINPVEGIDIDHEHDFLLAELVAKNKRLFNSVF